MADKVEKPKKQKAKPKQDEQGVLAALPATRGERIGSRRGAAKPPPAPKTTTATAASKAAAKPAAKPAAAKQPAAKKRAPATRTPAAKARATLRDGGSGSSYPRPQAVREGAPGMGAPAPRAQPAPASSEHGRPSGVELVSTAVQAAGELAQLGLSIGGQVLKRAVERLPKP
jgi:hypothetical protein